MFAQDSPCDNPLDPHFGQNEDCECDYSKASNQLTCYYINPYIIEGYVDSIGCMNSYDPPTYEQLSQFRCHVQDFLNDPANYNGDSGFCQSNLSELGYEIITYEGYTFFFEKDTDPSQDTFDKGWGTFVYNPATERKNLIIEVNHPDADKRTEWIGPNVFADTDAAWLLVAGAHRYACVEGENCTEGQNCGADMAREQHSVFQIFHEEITNYFNGDIYALSIHGFGDSYDTYIYDDEVGIVISNGDGLDGKFLAPSQLTQMLVEQFNSEILGETDNYQQPAITVYDAISYNYFNMDSLGATLSPQGTYTNTNFPDLDPRWIHMEADSLIREKNSGGGFRNQYYTAIENAVSDFFNSTNLDSYGCDSGDHDTGACNLVYCDGTSNSGKIYDDGVCECSVDMPVDCAGICGGSAVLSGCDNVCNSTAVEDCAGECGGTAIEDACGECGGDNSTCLDCAGVPNGDNLEDMCGTCDSDPSNDCTQDCAGTWGGNAVFDECGVCSGGTSGHVANSDDKGCGCFNGPPTGCTGDGVTDGCLGYTEDTCGVCGGNGWDDCDDDNNGINNKEQYGHGAYGLSAIDIPDDQGGYVYLSFTKSFYDTDTLTTVITENWEDSGIEGYFVERLDNGIWTNIASSPAYGADSYQVEARTLADSTSISDALTEYRVIAAMQEGNFVSIDTATGYSVDNIAPETPESFSGVYGENNAVLSWNPSDANDLSHYNIYRNDTLKSTTTETSFSDEITEDTEYKVSAVDIHENESDMSASILVSKPMNIIDNLIPTKYELMTAYPNPFNPITNITYGLPEYTNIQIVIFDLSGKQIASLINEFQSPGYHSINWNADSHPSGMYFVNMITSEYISTQKLMLVK